MNQKSQDDSLDQLLHQWADERAAASSEIDTLQNRISLAIRDDDSQQSKPVPAVSSQQTSEVTLPLPDQLATFTPRPVWPLRARLVNRLVGATLIATVAFVGSTHFLDVSRRRLEVPEVNQSTIPEYVQLTDDQISDRKIVLAEMKNLFGDQLNWLAETDSDFEVGLGEDPMTSETPLPMDEAMEIAVRVVVEERTSSEGAWQRTWAVDVISHHEEVVELAAKNDDRTTMTMWAFVLPDGMVAIESELELSESNLSTTSTDASPFRATFSNVQKDRQPSEASLIGANGVEYRVFQTVAVLNKKVS